ncbi:DUF4351 domain-containing protein, partial [Nostoc ellipsosporum NOK]|nr:DUF4351 domain-containing protein [Nostoc ellipsosporum NOK]
MQQVLDLRETIVLYKLPRLSRQELIKMFELDTFDIKKTRFYEEVKEEILDEVKQQVRNEIKQEQTLEVVMRQLRRRIGNVDQQIQERISQL